MSTSRELLVINPNTTGSVTRLLHEAVQAEVGPSVRVRSVGAAFGAPYISDEASYAIAAHAALDAWRTQPVADAVLIGCFGDPGLFALRETCGVPVTGLAEAAFTEAAAHGRFAVVTGGARWEPMLQRLALALEPGRHLAGVQTVAATGAELAADPVGAIELLGQACRTAVSRFDPAAVIVGGAALAGMAAALQDRFTVPLIDSVGAGARQAAALLRR